MKKKRTKGRLQEFQQGEFPEERQEKTRKKKTVRVNKTRIILTVIVIALIAVVAVSINNIFELQAEKQDLEQTKKELLTEKNDLKQELKNVNDVGYIEEQARIQLKLIRPGEVLYVLENEKDSDGKNQN